MRWWDYFLLISVGVTWLAWPFIATWHHRRKHGDERIANDTASRETPPGTPMIPEEHK